MLCVQSRPSKVRCSRLSPSWRLNLKRRMRREKRTKQQKRAASRGKGGGWREITPAIIDDYAGENDVCIGGGGVKLILGTRVEGLRPRQSAAQRALGPTSLDITLQGPSSETIYPTFPPFPSLILTQRRRRRSSIWPLNKPEKFSFPAGL